MCPDFDAVVSLRTQVAHFEAVTVEDGPLLCSTFKIYLSPNTVDLLTLKINNVLLLKPVIELLNKKLGDEFDYSQQIRNLPDNI